MSEHDELRARYDAIVIGGGAAGLNGALMLARSRRSVAVIDAGEPRNAPAAGVHGMLGHDGVPPAELLATGRAEVRSYGGHIVAGRVSAAAREGEWFTVTLTDGRRAHARRLLVTTGMVDELPDIPGLREHWGGDVVHCPYCHGWEVRDREIAVIATGPMATHSALLFRQLSDRVTMLANGHELTEDDAARLKRRGIEVVPGAVAAVEGEDAVTGVRLEDGTVIGCGAVAVGSRARPRADFLSGLGLETVAHPSGMGDHVEVDASGRTSVPGVWAAGNVADISAQVGASAAAGALAGAHINADLVMEEADRG